MEKRNQILRENKSSVSVKLFSFLVLKSDAPFQTQLKFNISQPPRTNILPPEITFNLILILWLNTSLLFNHQASKIERKKIFEDLEPKDGGNIVQ